MDVQKTMEFILEQQAEHSAQIGELHSSVKMLATTAEHMLAVQQQQEATLAVLANSQIQLTEAQKRLTDAQTHLTEAQAQTEERLNILVQTVQDILPRLPKQ